MASSRTKRTADNKTRRTQLRADFVTTANPFIGMRIDGRISALASLREGARKDFQDSVHRLVNLVGSANPLQLLAHFAYYDQLHLQETKNGSNYTPASQSAVEWLQALTLRVSVS